MHHLPAHIGEFHPCVGERVRGLPEHITCIRPVPSRWFTWAEPAVYAVNASVRVSRWPGRTTGARSHYAFVDQSLAFGALDSACVALPQAAREAETAV